MNQKFSPQSDEELVTVVNEHWITLVSPIVFFIMGWIGGLSLFFLAQEFFSPSFILAFVFFCLGLIVLVLTTHFFFIYLFRHFLSNIYVTTQRIVVTHVTAYVQNDTNFIQLDDIREVEKKRHGLLQNILSYGTVIIKFGGGSKVITFFNIPHPGKLANFIEAFIQGNFKNMPPADIRKTYASDTISFSGM